MDRYPGRGTQGVWLESMGSCSNVESGGIPLGCIQKAPNKRNLGTINFLLRMRFPELTSRGRVTADARRCASLLFVGSWAKLKVS